MAASTFTYEYDTRETSFIPVILFSCIFHILVFFVVPVLSRFVWKSKTFERPKTFQLVQIPQKVAPIPEKVVRKPKKKAVPKKPVPKTKKDSKPVKKEKPEDLSELEELLGGLPQPVSQITIGKKFPYPWYIRNIQMKVERNWKPPVNDESIAVVLRFTVFANGKISDVNIAESSGNSVLDNLAVRAVKLAAPFGKIPVGYKDNKLELSYELIPALGK